MKTSVVKVRKIELLAPAKNLECGIEAINHGADAVYIGAPKFGARSAANNTLENIEQLVKYAHQFRVKIYVALNTILRDDELAETEQLIWNLYRIGIDALIVQDMGVTQLNLPPLPLHASTQTDNRTIDKVKFLEAAGFSQIVLARELTFDEIRTIASNVKIPIEVFVHGALCVCYSGQCYLSEAISKRSANRGSCAQFCRLPYTLVDSEGVTIEKKKHFLSMKDLNLSEQLEDLLDAGVTSLKIEGRLKDVSYVKNVVAYYRQKLDQIFDRRVEYVRASSGKSTCFFNPNLSKSFNRGYTSYFFDGRTSDMWTPDSPKSIGEFVGKVESVSDKFIILSGTSILNNGDGLCFLNCQNELIGTRVNCVDGCKVYLTDTSQLKRGVLVYRNLDHEFEKILSRKSADRKISANILLKDIAFGYSIEIVDEDRNRAILCLKFNKELAQKNQDDNIIKNLSKTGNTIIQVNKVAIEFSANWFIPASILSEWRRRLIERLIMVRLISHRQELKFMKPTTHSFPIKEITYLGNVMNEKSKLFYNQHQSIVRELAFEKNNKNGVPLMFTRHCIKQTMGWCPKESKTKHPYQEPFYMFYNDTKLRLSFDCINCEMKVYWDKRKI